MIVISLQGPLACLAYGVFTWKGTWASVRHGAVAGLSAPYPHPSSWILCAAALSLWGGWLV